MLSTITKYFSNLAVRILSLILVIGVVCSMECATLYNTINQQYSKSTSISHSESKTLTASVSSFSIVFKADICECTELVEETEEYNESEYHSLEASQSTNSIALCLLNLFSKRSHSSAKDFTNTIPHLVTPLYTLFHTWKLDS